MFFCILFVLLVLIVVNPVPNSQFPIICLFFFAFFFPRDEAKRSLRKKGRDSEIFEGR